ncbi:hypothetical protein D3C80_2122470 [compost metagenome]
MGSGSTMLVGLQAITTPIKPNTSATHCQRLTRSLRNTAASTVTMIGAEKYRVVISARLRSRAAV